MMRNLTLALILLVVSIPAVSSTIPVLEPPPERPATHHHALTWIKRVAPFVAVGVTVYGVEYTLHQGGSAVVLNKPHLGHGPERYRGRVIPGIPTPKKG